jgi:SAM-dependent methyltransferase
MTNPTAVNPFYSARLNRITPRTEGCEQPVYARLPLAPRNASPVPRLTSLYHFHRAGEYGDRGYPGNCGGNLIKDLLTYFRPNLVLDPMSGSGTCADACDANDFSAVGTFDFIWAHPAYWRQKLYADDPRDLSRSPTLEHFLRRYGLFVRNCARALKPGGRLAVLMGDYCDREEGFVPLTFHTKRLAFAHGLRQCCTDIIRFSHGASSSRKVYRSSFIPGLHDTCMVFERASPIA